MRLRQPGGPSTAAKFELPGEALQLLASITAAKDEATRARTEVELALRETRAGIERAQRSLDEQAATRRRELDQQQTTVDATLTDIEKQRAALDALLDSRVRGLGFVAAAWGDYESARAATLAAGLERKSRPAPVAAEAVREQGKRLRELHARARTAELKTELLLWHFPWLEEVLTNELVSPEELESFVTDASGESEENDTDDPARRWLSEEEYKALPSHERSQRALDRYLRSRESPWQLGRDYERYIGYLRERDGFNVTYHGIVKGFDDLGRDLLAEKNGLLEVIQCKRWAQSKTIHEKHLFQLFGTVIAARIENPSKTVTGTFVTTTSLSDRARKFATQLDINIDERVPLASYPQIKCNIQLATGQRIYHLPFDRAYDATLVEPARGERFAFTAKEAEDEGFRRAWRWAGQRPS